MNDAVGFAACMAGFDVGAGDVLELPSFSFPTMARSGWIASSVTSKSAVLLALFFRLRLRLDTRNELMVAAVFVRSVLGVSPSAFEDACSVMGPEDAATVIACTLEKGGHTNSAGGYLRDLRQPTEKGEFLLGPVLMAQLRASGGATRKVG